MPNHQQKEFHTITPYLYGRPDLIDFLKQVLGAEELYRGTGGDAWHMEMRIGDSRIMLGIGNTPNAFGVSSKWGRDPNARNTPPATLYVYVENADEVYRRALEAGATSLGEPEDQPWRDRIAGFRDSYGNNWWVATYKSAE